MLWLYQFWRVLKILIRGYVSLHSILTFPIWSQMETVFQSVNKKFFKYWAENTKSPHQQTKKPNSDIEVRVGQWLELLSASTVMGLSNLMWYNR
jgi:hypothetical protein